MIWITVKNIDGVEVTFLQILWPLWIIIAAFAFIWITSLIILIVEVVKTLREKMDKNQKLEMSGFAILSIVNMITTLNIGLTCLAIGNYADK